MIRSQASGFTYIEVLAVLAFVAILGLTMLPQLVLPDTLQAEQTARQLAADLRLTQELAIAQRAYYVLQFSPATAPYRSYTVYSNATGTAEPDFPRTISSGITVSGRQAYCFTMGGAITDSCAGGTGTNGSNTVAAGTATATVWVYWYNGRVQVVGP